MIKDIWSKIAYYWFIGMLIIVGFFCGQLVIKASELQNWSSKVVRFWYDDHGTEGATSWQNDPYYYSPTLPVTRVQWGLKTGAGFNRENSYTFQFGYKPVPDAINVSNMVMLIGSDVQEFSCSNWSRNQYGYYLTSCSFTPSQDYTNSDYLYVVVYFNQAYLTQIVSYMNGYEERLGINAVVTQQTSIINNSINNLNNNISNSDVEDPTGMLDDMEDLIATNGTITNLISLPITLYTKVLNSINGTCSQFNLGSLYNHNLIIPCINVSTYLGSTLWNLIDIIISGAFVLIIAKKMIKAFENFTSMKEGDVINND